MFDVDWSDPNRESIGDRRARKHNAAAKDKDKQGGKTTASLKDDNGDGGQESSGNKFSIDLSRHWTSGSIRSSESSGDRQFSFFGGKKRSKSGSSRKGKPKSLEVSSTYSPVVEEEASSKTPSTSSINQPRQTDGVGESPILASKRHSDATESILSKHDDLERAPGGSLFGCDITNPQPGHTSLLQEFSDGCSMITKTTTIDTRKRVDGDGEFLVSHVFISARDNGLLPSAKGSLTKSFTTQDLTQYSEVMHFAPNTEQSNHKAIDESYALPAIAEDSDFKSVKSSPPKKKQQNFIRSQLSAPVISPAAMRPLDNAGTWKAPVDWEISPTEPRLPTSASNHLFNVAPTSQYPKDSLDISHVQRETERMLRAPLRNVLQQLSDNSDDLAMGRRKSGPEASDSNEKNKPNARRLQSERDMEKKRWMLIALYNMETIWAPEEKPSRPKVMPNVQKVLALFETQGTASYLAATNISTPIYHLSPEPLSHRDYPNIHPVICPTISVSTLAMANESFSSVSCLPMTSILPSAEIPKLLQSIHRILAPGGYLHMIIIDPWPISSSMGPLLQRWIDHNLVLNLELSFRTSHPSRNFPIWLDEARLRGQGSVITNTRFMAVSSSDNSGNSIISSAATTAAALFMDNVEEDKALKKQLRTMVGRILWKEIWGSLVTAGERWWWEIPEIVRECAERKTWWEYSIIAACKAPNS